MTVPDNIENNKLGHPETPLYALFDNDWTTRRHRPATELQAIMEAGPSDTIQDSEETGKTIAEAVTRALNVLDARAEYVLNSILFEQITFQELADRMSISTTHAHRLYDHALAELKHELMNSEPITEHLGMTPTWETAAYEELLFIEDAPTDISYTPLDLKEIATQIQTFENRITNDRGSVYTTNALTDMATVAVDYLASLNRWDIRKHHQLICDKHQDYGINNINKHGLQGVCVRMSDKVARLDNLVKNGKAPRNESVTDTFYDIIGYACIARMLQNGTFDRAMR